MDAHCYAILEEYKVRKPSFDKMLEVVLDKLHETVNSLGILTNSIEGRVKTEQSLVGKLELKGSKYQSLDDITDIIGCRVVTFYSKEVDMIAALLEQYLDIDWDNSVDKRKAYSVDTFGYMSLHFVCRIPKSVYFDEEHPEFNSIRFEIQLRTTLQHAWASIMHDTGYKNDVEVPAEYLRSMIRLSSLLELADDEFGRIKESIAEYRKHVKNIVASGDFASVSLNADSFQAYVKAGAFDKLNKKIASINNMDIQEVPLLSYLPIFKAMELQTLGDLDKLRKDHSDDAYRLMLRQLSGTDIDIVTSSIGLNAICIVYILKSGFGEEGLTRFMTMVYGLNKNTERRVRRMFELARQVGLVK